MRIFEDAKDPAREKLINVFSAKRNGQVNYKRGIWSNSPPDMPPDDAPAEAWKVYARGQRALGFTNGLKWGFGHAVRILKANRGLREMLDPENKFGPVTGNRICEAIGPDGRSKRED